MVKNPIIERLKEVLSANNFSGLAARLGTYPPNIHQAIKGRQIPEVWLLKAAYETRCRLEWLKTGEPPKYIEGAVSEVQAAYGLNKLDGIETLIEQWRDLNEESRRFVESCARAAKYEDHEFIQPLVNKVLEKHEHDQANKAHPKKKV